MIANRSSSRPVARSVCVVAIAFVSLAPSLAADDSPIGTASLGAPHAVAARVPRTSFSAPRIHWGPTVDAFEPIAPRSESPRPSPVLDQPAVAVGQLWQPTQTDDSNRPRRLPKPDPPAEPAFGNQRSASVTVGSRRTTTPAFSTAPTKQPVAAAPAPSMPAPSSLYLASQTAKSQGDEAEKWLAQAELEYRCGAMASAETSVWQAMKLAASAVDLQHVQAGWSRTVPGAGSASERLQNGRDALIEAQDFAGPYADAGPMAIARLARAHRTAVIRQTLPSVAEMSLIAHSLPTATEAIDRYLNFARAEFASVAADSLPAARGMDLLAAIRMGRNEVSQLPGPTAICLRRAAVQGQSQNAELAGKLGHHLVEVGLLEEATWAYTHSLSLREDPVVRGALQRLSRLANRVPNTPPPPHSVLVSSAVQTRTTHREPEVVPLSPEQFASISQSVLRPQDVAVAAPIAPPAQLASTISPATRLMAPPMPTQWLAPAKTASYRMTAPPATDAEPAKTSRFPSLLKKWW